MLCNELWIDTRLSEEAMKFLNVAISEENKENHSNFLAGNISKSELINDKDNWFFKSNLKKLTERMFYRESWNNYYKYHIEAEEGILLPEFKITKFWVNYQKQHEFNPPHNHLGNYSFVIFMKIPTHWKEQHALPISENSNAAVASNFCFLHSKKNSESVDNFNFNLSSEDEGRMLFFPSSLNHQVFPFYGTEEERITISGNISLVDPNAPKEQAVAAGEYEEKKMMIEMLENSLNLTKQELKLMKKSETN
jgi:hypothetical protein